MFLSSLWVFSHLVNTRSRHDSVLHVLHILTKFPPAIRAMHIILEGRIPGAEECAALIQACHGLVTKAQELELDSTDEAMLPYMEAMKAVKLRNYEAAELIQFPVNTSIGLVELGCFNAVWARLIQFSDAELNKALFSKTPNLFDGRSKRAALLGGGLVSENIVFDMDVLYANYKYKDNGNESGMITGRDLSDLLQATQFGGCGGDPGRDSLMFRPTRRGECTVDVAMAEHLLKPILVRRTGDGTAIFEGDLAVPPTCHSSNEAPDEIIMVCLDYSRSMTTQQRLGEIRVTSGDHRLRMEVSTNLVFNVARLKLAELRIHMRRLEAAAREPASRAARLQQEASAKAAKGLRIAIAQLLNYKAQLAKLLLYRACCVKDSEKLAPWTWKDGSPLPVALSGEKYESDTSMKFISTALDLGVPQELRCPMTQELFSDPSQDFPGREYADHTSKSRPRPLSQWKWSTRCQLKLKSGILPHQGLQRRRQSGACLFVLGKERPYSYDFRLSHSGRDVGDNFVFGTWMAIQLCTGRLGDEPFCVNYEDRPQTVKVDAGISGGMPSLGIRTGFYQPPVLKIFGHFVDEILAYKYSMHMELITYSTKAHVAQRLTHDVKNFGSTVLELNGDGDTALWDALALAHNHLQEYAETFPNAKKRILCISDGSDTSSDQDHQPSKMCEQFLRDGIVVDSFDLGHNSSFTGRAKLSFLTNGYKFKPTSLEQAMVDAISAARRPPLGGNISNHLPREKAMAASLSRRPKRRPK
ncbi:hypothetical protein B0T26DRAFT_799042 [Lasiosphaeria miniovina]|uniref:VWFA domain-containing protein n=1 Tax=Lasiosphaeria miniovina TaxID=1954250 RepID=A0AA40B3B2_9PEZI|nr:uncharacterized protein B0T26DRAFT_799042 [Lasiosphaeria miniovina]KAK0726898.1 hypothetical protein B0T26DRAFT_799042 [Lasiosphaeria miniovina]